MLQNKDIETLRMLFSSHNYVMTTAELTASKLYYADMIVCHIIGKLQEDAECIVFCEFHDDMAEFSPKVNFQSKRNTFKVNATGIFFRVAFTLKIR